MAVHAAGVAGCAGDGNAKREACLRPPGDGFELFQSRLNHRRRRLGWWLDPHFGERWLIGLAIGTLIGGLLQLAVQLPSLRRVGFRFQPDFKWRDQGVRAMLTLMAPAMIAASAVQVNVADQQRIRRESGQWPDELAKHCFSFDAIAARNFWRRGRRRSRCLWFREARRSETSMNFAAFSRAECGWPFLLTIPSAIGLAMLA